MQRVAAAIETISRDPEIACTKRSIERVSGLSHDAVARAFRQDRAEDSEHKLNARFDAVVEQRRGRRTATEQRVHDAEEGLRAARERITELEAELASYAQVILAQHLELEELRNPEGRVIVMPKRGRHSGTSRSD